MFVQTLNTPNPNSLKFLPGEKVSLSGPLEFTEKNQTSNELIRIIITEKIRQEQYSSKINLKTLETLDR